MPGLNCLILCFELKKVIMKRAIVLIFIIGIALSACKSTKKASKSPYEPATTTPTTTSTKIFTVPQNTTPENSSTEKTYSTRKEAITFVQPEQQNQNGFFVIVGSYSSLENANKFRQTLIGEGFNPVIVQSETGFYRVTVDSFTNETAARSRLIQIRQNYPQYGDSWLLIKK
jgi:cell division protein FtsN